VHRPKFSIVIALACLFACNGANTATLSGNTCELFTTNLGDLGEAACQSHDCVWHVETDCPNGSSSCFPTCTAVAGSLVAPGMCTCSEGGMCYVQTGTQSPDGEPQIECADVASCADIRGQGTCMNHVALGNLCDCLAI